MYGMIHRALLLILDQKLGPDANPLQAARRARPELFLSAAVHDDDSTVRMLNHAAAAVEMPLEAFMIEFGEFWIRFADQDAYAGLMRAAGDTLPDFIRNLDRLHTGVRDALPTALTPRFRLVSDSGDEIRVGYASTRNDLEPFVQGLLQGLARRFGREGAVTIVPSERAGEVCFRISFGSEG